LPHQRASASLACRAIVDAVSEAGWFPHDWRPDKAFVGGVIERCRDGSYRIHWKAEIGVMRHAIISVDRYANAADAAKAWLRRMFPNDIDGVEIDWAS
jgi:hypothetical protein